MAIKSIIFDLDGTIADTEHIWFRATNDFLARRNIILNREDKEQLYKQLNGFALIPACHLIKKTLGLSESAEEIAHEKKEQVLSLYKESIQFIDGFVACHGQVNNEGLTSGIATNANDDTLAVIKNALQLERFFGEHIYNISHVNNRHKPDPALYQHAALQLGRMPQECIAIEDSAHGIAAAQAAGMYCIGINTSKKLFQVAKADLIVDHYDQIKLSQLI